MIVAKHDTSLASRSHGGQPAVRERQFIAILFNHGLDGRHPAIVDCLLEMPVTQEEEPRTISAIVPEKPEPQYTKPKLSILGRMINSLRPQAPREETNKLTPRGDGVVPINEAPDIYDVPAFLRRK